MSHEQSISLEQTNKFRISIGLQPVTDDDAPANDQDQQAEDNYARHRQIELQVKEAQNIRDCIAKVRNQRELKSSLQSARLGDGDSDDDDVLSWIKKNKRKEESQDKIQQHLEDTEVSEGGGYSEKDLVSLKVSHDLDEMDAGETRMLTLKDSRLLDDEDDAHENVGMAAKKSRKRNKDLTTKKRPYTGYDDDEFVSVSEGVKRSVLAKYDEDIRDNGFRLDISMSTQRFAQEEKPTVDAIVDMSHSSETTDYLKEGEVGFKKPKTNKKRPSRRTQETSEIHSDDFDQHPIIPRVRDLDCNFVDDDELQATLTRSRKAKIHMQKMVSPEEVAKKIAAQRKRKTAAGASDNATAGSADEDQQSQEGAMDGLIFDDTAEFVRTIKYNPTSPPSMATKDDPLEPHVLRAPRSSSLMEVDHQPVQDREARELCAKGDDDDELAMIDDLEDAFRTSETKPAFGATSSEQNFGGGMASTLNILRQQGIIAAPTADRAEREKIQLQRDLWLADQRRRIAQRGRGGANNGHAQREFEYGPREQRASFEAFKSYKPDINTDHYDEFGRTLSVKEAWKALSHDFHGKGSGRMKMEKRLKKIAEEKRREAGHGDTSTALSMDDAFRVRRERTGQAHFVLSVGN